MRSSETGISVVVPLYNKRGEIRRCLESIANQTIQPDEVIVVDDGSTDGSPEIAASVPCPGLRMISQGNQGAAAARNTGIQAAAGPLIAFLDADDEWLPEFLADILRLKNTFPQAGAFATAYTIDKGRFRRYNVVRDVAKEFTLFAAGQGFHVIWSSSVAIRNNVFQAVGLFRPGVRQVEDQDMWFRIACVFPIAYSAVPRAIWHWTASNRSPALTPIEEDCMGESLKEVADRGLIPDAVLPQAQAQCRQFRFRQALVVAGWNHAKGLQALKTWRAENGASLRWYLHYVPLTIHPGAYWSFLRYGSRVKDLVRTAMRAVRETSRGWWRKGLRRAHP